MLLSVGVVQITEIAMIPLRQGALLALDLHDLAVERERERAIESSIDRERLGT